MSINCPTFYSCRYFDLFGAKILNFFLVRFNIYLAFVFFVIVFLLFLFLLANILLLIFFKTNLWREFKNENRKNKITYISVLLIGIALVYCFYILSVATILREGTVRVPGFFQTISDHIINFLERLHIVK